MRPLPLLRYSHAQPDVEPLIDAPTARRFLPAFDANKPTDQWFRATSGAGEFHIQVTYKPATVRLVLEPWLVLLDRSRPLTSPPPTGRCLPSHRPSTCRSTTLTSSRLSARARSARCAALPLCIRRVAQLADPPSLFASPPQVMQVRKKDTGRIYALKTIRKAHIVSRSEVTHTLAERTVLAQVNNPFIVPLKFSFQNAEKLYLVLAFVNGGELFHHLQREGRFNEERSRFYAAELLCALEHLHQFNVIYRCVLLHSLIVALSWSALTRRRPSLQRPQAGEHPHRLRGPHRPVRLWPVQAQHERERDDQQCVQPSLSRDVTSVPAVTVRLGALTDPTSSRPPPPRPSRPPPLAPRAQRHAPLQRSAVRPSTWRRNCSSATATRRRCVSPLPLSVDRLAVPLPPIGD